MPDDQLFRIVILIGFAAVLPFSIYFRMRSASSRDKLDRRQEGLFILLTLRPISLASMLGLLTFLVSPHLMAWSSVPLPMGVRWAGVGLGVLGGVLLVWTMRTLGSNLTDTVVTRRRHTLVTAGPYRFVRHPFYGASALAILANTLTAANWFVGLTGMAALTLLVIRTSTEEEHLTQRFGQDYVRYKSQTARFLPRMVRR